MRLTAAIGVMKHMSKTANRASLLGLGITDPEINLITSEEPWVGSDRPGVVRTMDAICNGSAHVMGLDPFQLSAEYVAAHLFTFVHFNNWATICAWMQRYYRVDDLASAVDAEPMKPERLHAFLVLLADEGDSSFRYRFEKAVEKAQAKSAPAQ